MRRIALIALLAALVTAAPASARIAQPWATVNVCDTRSHPNQIGIRGSMPGLARFSRMYMRFRVQYRKGDEWRAVTAGGDSGWRLVGAGRRGTHEAGWTFEYEPPAAGGAHVLRGVVSFKWRRARHVVARARRVTEAGHPGTLGADPPDFSADTCEIA